MCALSRDTSNEAEQVQIELLRRPTPTRKFLLSQSMTSSALHLQRRALRDLHPELDEQELRLLVVTLNYGEELGGRVRARVEAEP